MSTEPFAASVIPINIEDEMRTSYLDYSMSVIIGRALPDVRDGLKPVHRRRWRRSGGRRADRLRAAGDFRRQRGGDVVDHRLPVGGVPELAER